MTTLPLPLWLVFVVFGGGVGLVFLSGLVLGRWWRRGDPAGDEAAVADADAAGAEVGVTPPAWYEAPREPRVMPSSWSDPESDVPSMPGSERWLRSSAVLAGDGDGEQPSILMIDDRVELLAMHAAYLHRHGYRTLIAGDGRTGLEMARTHAPALIVLDHSMPGLTGVQVAQELKADPATAQIPILFMTAHTYGSVGAAALAAGCAAYLPKPVDPSRLLREIEARAPLH